MSVGWRDAIRVGRSLIGTPYDRLDCINFIKRVIRSAPGGVASYTTAGTNSLWKSFDMSAKYKDLTWRQQGIEDARAGMIAFKEDGSDVHHAGIVTDVGTVLHSSSTQGGRGVVETPLTAAEGWNLLAVHRYIRTDQGGEESVEAYAAIIRLNDPESTVNVRNGPSTGNRAIGKLTHGAPVIVQAEMGGWCYITYGDSGVGYVHQDYVERMDGEPETDGGMTVQVVITDEEGNTFRPVGAFTVDLELLLDGEPLDAAGVD